MSGWLPHYALFAAELATLILLIALAVLAVTAAARERRTTDDGFRVELRNLGRRLQSLRDSLESELLPSRERRRRRKQRTREHRRQRRAGTRPRLFVLDFVGDLQASRTRALREEISVLLQVVREGDAVLLRLESTGGLVHGYGLAASQLLRLRGRGVRLTVAVDKVAASGGYLMACVADRIVAAPFAVLGSIGVVGELPNFNRWLKTRNIDFELHTAGEYKRTLTLFGENTDAARQKFIAELEDVHALFKGFVLEHRPQLEIEKVATGEHWYGSRALELGLVDAVSTSDECLMQALEDHDVFELRVRLPHYWRRRLLKTLTGTWNGHPGATPPISAVGAHDRGPET